MRNCIIVTLVMIWQWGDPGHNPAPGPHSPHPDDATLWHGDMVRQLSRSGRWWHWRCCCGGGSGPGVCDSDPSPSVSQMCCCLFRRDGQRHEAWHPARGDIVQHCDPSCHQSVATWLPGINWAIAQLMIPRQNWQEVRWTWGERGFLLCVAIKS